ncbi:hypothetical protein AAC387_Pa05g1861 [Persea americana]
MEEDDDVESQASSDSLELDQREEKWIQHYSNSHRILLVGEGDFSFSVSLANAFGSATNMVATSLDSQETLARIYTNGIKNVMELEELGGLVLLGIDATKMSDHFFLRTQRFDRIIYNFPHVGFQYSESSNFQIESNKRLLKGFFKNAKVILQDNGEIHVTHKIGGIYDKWNVVKKAEKNGLIQKGRVPFSKADYPGYCNKRAHGRLPDDEFYIGACSTFIFGVKEACSRIRNTT